MLRLKILQSRWTAVCWFVGMCILFFLPGTMLPKETNFLSLLRIDKLVHIGLFAVLIFLIKSSFKLAGLYPNLALIVLSGAYGYAVEWIQGHWIPGRSFDLFDLTADIVGSMVGLLAWEWVKKNKPL